MAKTNFTKVEEVLDQGLRKYEVEHLLKAADAAGKPKEKNPGIAYTQEEKPTLTAEQTQLVKSLQFELKRVQKRDPSLYKKLGIAKKELGALLDNPSALKAEEWERVKEAKTKLDQIKEELKKLPNKTDDDLVDAERKDHINRRYNVNKKWLPLT